MRSIPNCAIGGLALVIASALSHAQDPPATDDELKSTLVKVGRIQGDLADD